MDIHRCRFVPYRPQSINTLAFSHQSNPKSKSPQHLRLAIGRENGDIEIWNPTAGNWFQEKILRGSRDRTVERVEWTQDLVIEEGETNVRFSDGPLRLFSSGGSSSLTEWNIATGQPKRHAEGHLGDIWCFAAQPQWKRTTKGLYQDRIAATASQLLAAGYADGSIDLFSTADDTLQYVRPLTASTANKKAKVISITWRDRNTVVAGYENGTIQVIDVPTRSVIRTMTLGKSPDGGLSVVWTLKCLADGTILSGDSSGELKIWDAKNLSLAQRLKAHDADILDITASVAGNIIFTTGVDRRVCVFRQIGAPVGNNRERWQKSMHRRFHQHDVKTLAGFEAKGFSILVSGGMDTVPIVMPLRNWDTEYHRSLSHLPQKPQMSCSSTARLMLTWWDRALFIWNLPTGLGASNVDSGKFDAVNFQLLARIELKDDDNITSAQISQNGKMVVAATRAGVRLFQIRKRTEDGDIEIRTRPIELPQAIQSFGASSVGFSPNSKWLYSVRLSNITAVVKITPELSGKDKPQIHHQVIKLAPKSRRRSQAEPTKLDQYLSSINCTSFSSDSRIYATGDLSGAIDLWILEGHEDLLEPVTGHNSDSGSESDSDSDSDSDSEDESDSRVVHGQKWIRSPGASSLPKLDAPILALGLKPINPKPSDNSELALGLHATRHNPHPVAHELPSQDAKLVAVTSSHQIVEFDVFQGRLSDWTRRNPPSFYPQSFTQLKDRVMGMFWDCNSPSHQERLWLYGPNWLFMMDMSSDLNQTDAQDKIGQIGAYDVREPLSGSRALETTAQDSTLVASRRKRKRNTGAGDEKKPDGQVTTVPSRNYTGNRAIATGLPSPTSDREDDDEDNMDIDSTSALTQLRRGTEQQQPQSKNTTGPTTLTDTANPPQPTHQAPCHHLLTRYRSIFGIAALDLEQSSTLSESTTVSTTNPDLASHATTPPNLEIVLVERPIYDVDLLPRFDGGQDWST